jgi:tRNA-dihydrouridine synthase 1
VKEALHIPVIANGGVETVQDAYRCLAATGADGIMSSEALLEDPALFDTRVAPMLELNGAHFAHRQLKLSGEYLLLAAQYTPLVGVSPIRSHLFKMCYRLLNCHPDLRWQLADSGTRTVEGLTEVIRQLAARYHWDLDSDCAVISADECPPVAVDDQTWYRRHWQQ